MCDFAALKRKGKGSDVEEADMEAVVHAHNSKQTLSCICLDGLRNRPVLPGCWCAFCLLMLILKTVTMYSNE